MTLSTHVLDVADGIPAREVEVTLSRCEGEDRHEIARARTNGDGRIEAPFGGELSEGEYEMTFRAGEYFARCRTPAFYDRITVRFRIENAQGFREPQHYHVPLLLAPWGYSTYRGS